MCEIASFLFPQNSYLLTLSVQTTFKALLLFVKMLLRTKKNVWPISIVKVLIGGRFPIARTSGRELPNDKSTYKSYWSLRTGLQSCNI